MSSVNIKIEMVLVCTCIKCLSCNTTILCTPIASGFLATPDGYLQGNAGMRDQVMALEFIRDNIAAFGGDPNRVTAFGQSAGGSSTALLLVSPLSQGRSEYKTSLCIMVPIMSQSYVCMAHFAL